MIPAVVSLAMKKKAERRVRQLLREDGFAQPDEVEYGPDWVTFFWHSAQKSIEVEVTDQGEVGESRLGPPSPKWDLQAAGKGTVCAGGVASLAQKKAAEADARKLLEDGGVPQPDVVEYGYTCIRLLWDEPKFALIVDLDEPPPAAAA